MNCIPWVNTAVRAHKHTQTDMRAHRILKPSQACRCSCAWRAGWWRGWTVEASFALVCRPRRAHKRARAKTHSNSYCTPARFITPFHTRVHQRSQQTCWEYMRKLSQTTPPLPPPPPTKALMDSRWALHLLFRTRLISFGGVPRGGSRTKTGLMEAVKLSYSLPK